MTISTRSGRSLPPRTVLGRLGGRGAPTAISLDELAQHTAAIVTGGGGGVAPLPAIADGDVLANTSGSSAKPIATTVSDLLDHALGSAQGDILFRGASGWEVLAHGTSGQFLETQGAGADVKWGDAGSGSGTVTSVAATVPSDFSVSGSPITTTGTLAITENTQSANTVKAGPSSGSAAAPTYRALAAADIPAISLTAGVSGVLPIANGGTGNSAQNATARSSAVAPTGTTSTTRVMMGLGFSFTPAATGRAMFVVSAFFQNSVATDGIKADLLFGTGTAPTNGAAETGTLLLPAGVISNSNLGGAPCFLNLMGFTAALTAGTTYWIDVSLAAFGGGTASMGVSQFAAVEY